ncbi:MAG: DUF2163 domain-containing protein [Alphaproteobacteria bacterium]|nr:MAG: DUF2163 domain-containing protein [Alphaproteobacteria bacterium]
MKTLPPALAAHLGGDVLTLAWIATITRADGVVLGLTSFERDVTVEGLTYRAAPGFRPGPLEDRADLATGTQEILGIFDDAALTEEDIRAGRYDGAQIEMALINWADSAAGRIVMRRGWIGQIVHDGDSYHAEMRGLHDRLQQPIGAWLLPECRHSLGDAGCRVSPTGWTVTGSVTAVTVTDRAQFTDAARAEAAGHFAYGRLTFTGGANAGLAAEVKDFAAGGQFSLWLAMPHDISAGDTYSVTAGCDRRLASCQAKFNNVSNFGGFPHLPGLDRLLAYPDASA